MVTDLDREFAPRQARLIYENHLRNHPDFAINHIALNIDYLEALRRGLLCECAWVNECGGAVRTDLGIGDGGKDFIRQFMTNHRGMQSFPVNVKGKSVWGSWRALVRSGTHLRVPVKETKPNTIYVLGVYHQDTDDAEVMRWTWGRALIERNERRVFRKNSSGVTNFLMPFELLRDLAELKARLAPTQ